MKIMVGIDGSGRALTALEHGALFARCMNAELVLLRVMNPVADCADMPGLTLAEATGQLRSRWIAELDELAPSDIPSATVEVVAKERSESTADALVRAAAEGNVQLIVLGTRGTGIARRALIGSVATQVLHRSQLPVMLTGESAEKPKDSSVVPYRVLIATDGCQPSESVVTEFARAMDGAPAANLSVTAVHVSEWGYAPSAAKRDEAAQRLAAFTARLPQQFHPQSALLPDDERLGPTETILAYAREVGAHSIWMATQGDSWPRQVFLGSVALSTVEHAHIPVVLVRAGAA